MRNSSKIVIMMGSTRIRVRVPQQHPLFQYLRDVLKRKMTDYTFDPRFKKWDVMYRYYYYSRMRSEMVLPTNTLKMITDELDIWNDNGISYEIRNEELVQGRHIDIAFNKGVEPKPHQVPVIEQLIKDDPQRSGLSLQTGGGKTFVAIATAVKRSKCTMVVVSGLTDQWVKSFRQFTNVEDKIVEVKGVKSLLSLMEAEEKPHVIVFSLETLRLYVQRAANYEDIPSYEQFIKYFGVDLKIMDEVHLNFHCCTMIDLHSNIAKNIYLTATFTNGNIQTRKIFNLVYPKEMIIGGDNRDKYIRIWSYGYRIYVPEKVYLKLRGYSHVKYEAYFYKHESKLKHFYDTVLIPVINAHFINRCKPGQRCLIFFSTIDMIMSAKQYLEKEYPNKKVGVYIGESKEGAYNDYEIIVSNHKKAGTGTDIKELYTVINTVSFSTPTLTEQSLGRLRKLPNGDTPEYIDLVNIACGTHLQHRLKRKEIQEPLALEYRESILP